MKLILILFSMFVCIGLHSPQGKNETRISYLALGDSYTIGESVDEKLRWPVQLVSELKENEIGVDTTVIIAETGWRTDEMLKAAKKQLKDEKFDLVSLLIGVNNEYQGWDVDQFEPEFERSLKFAVDRSKHGANGVFVVSIPDYGYTPFGSKNRKNISPRINAYNKVCRKVSKAQGVKYYNITPISRQDKKDKSLVAKDGLHPSGKQYGLWVKSFAKDVVEMVGRNQD